MRRINLVTWNNGRGLKRDIQILSRILHDAGHRIDVNGLSVPYFQHNFYPHHFPYRLVTRCLAGRRPAYDVNLFLEYVVPEWLDRARVNYLIPNQEWFRDEYHPYLPDFELVLCKTKFAQHVFERLGCRREFISFTSYDRLSEGHDKSYRSFFHLAGSSLHKGTRAVVEVWRRHPEWPPLTIVQSPRHARQVAAANINYIVGRLKDAALRRHQNVHGIHVCPSEAERFGHSIVEAMSCRSVAITTDAPPMNELVSPERGVLAAYRSAESQRMGIMFYVDHCALEQKVQEVLGLTQAAKNQLGDNAREWYLQNHLYFRRRVVEVLSEV
ncbi:MAG: glycosyltransferase [Pyrinomonadaceae bacterium]